MFDWLTRSLQNDTVLWLLLSSVVGGIIGSTTKFIFDILIPKSFKTREEILAIRRKYGNPIFLAASELQKRLENIISLIGKIEKEDNWLQKTATNDYYFISTLYLTAKFFGWVQILRRTVTFLDLKSTTETRSYSAGLEEVISCFSNPALLANDVQTGNPDESKDDKWIFSILVQAIGDLTVDDDGDAVIGFVQFYKDYKGAPDSDLQIWFRSLAAFYDGIKSSEARFRRIVAAHAILNAFIEMDDPKHVRSRAGKYYWRYLSEKEKDRVIARIRKFRPAFRAG